ncbi:MAG TPA: oligosaccharide flippase family protein [Myxococcales bacterium]|nr:oligosaccharide flippase family protein [Myxococcales bacterium]
MREDASFLGRARPLVLARMGTAVLTTCIPLVLARAMALREYGTYKQLFLISQTISYVLPFGMSQALYYFIPRSEVKRPYFVHAMAFLTAMGAFAVLALLAFEDRIGQAFSNPELRDYRWAQAVYLVGVMASWPLEISLTTQGRTRQSAMVYLVSDTSRAVAMVAPVLLGFGLRGLMICAAGHAAVRCAAAWTLALRSGPGPLFDWRLMRAQLAYALPFGAAMLVAIPQQYAHQYAVSATVSPEAFAIYAVGCLQLPIVDLLYTPTSEVLMVRLGELDKAGRGAEGLGVFREATSKLALAFFPLAAFLFAAAPELIGALFGPRFAEAAPLFRVSVVGVVLAIMPMDGVLRARGRTRYLFGAYLAKAILTVPLVWLGVKRFGMLGGIGSWAVAEAFGKAVLLARMPDALSASFVKCVPWRQLGKASAAAAVAAAGVVAVRALARPAYQVLPSGLLWRTLPLVAAGLLFGISYLVALRLVGVKPLSVLASLRGGAPARA